MSREDIEIPAGKTPAGEITGFFREPLDPDRELFTTRETCGDEELADKLATVRDQLAGLKSLEKTLSTGAKDRWKEDGTFPLGHHVVELRTVEKAGGTDWDKFKDLLVDWAREQQGPEAAKEITAMLGQCKKRDTVYRTVSVKRVSRK